MQKLLAIATLFATLSIASTARALDCPSPYLCFLNGSWSADGKAFGKPAHVTMQWHRILEGRFARIDYRIVTKSDDGKDQIFEGIGFYRPLKDGTYDGTWFDSQGAMHPLKAKFTGESLTAYWGVKGKTYGRTVYKIVNAYDQVEVIDAIQDKKGNWKEFSRNTLKKSE